MNEKKRQAAYAMIEYIDNYYRENRHTPSLREIEAKLGFSRQSALRYLQELDRDGALDPLLEKLAAVFVYALDVSGCVIGVGSASAGAVKLCPAILALGPAVCVA